MLKGIPSLLVPELLRALAEMGHGDVLAVVDRNFPAYAGARQVVELPAVDATTALEAILSLLPVDQHQSPAAWHMLTDDGESGPAAGEFGALLDRVEDRQVPCEGLPRPAFYPRAAEAFCTVRTGDDRPYACFLIAKGVVG